MKKSEEHIKISFVGDIMCEKPLLKSSNIEKDKYDFNDVFVNMRKMFAQSDYVVGNLETICAGEDLGYTNHIFSFNTPEEFIGAIKDSGIDLVTTATNHSLDRGIKGLKRNLDTLNKYELKNIGTYRTEEERNEIFLENLEGIKISFLNYTYGTNVHINEQVLQPNELFHVNLLQSQKEEIKRLRQKKESKSVKSIISRFVFKLITLEQWIKIKRFFRLPYNKAYKDDSLKGIDPTILEQIKNDVRNAKEKSDVVIMCMHSGGQFHPEPGKFSEFMMKFMDEQGVDIVIGNHPHVVQKCIRLTNGMVGAYSLGNFSISPSSVYVIHDDLPDYSIMLHLYIGKQSKTVERITFSILKIVEYENKNLTVLSIDQLFSSLNEKEKYKLITNATKLYNRFTGKNKKKIDIKNEYVFLDRELIER